MPDAPLRPLALVRVLACTLALPAAALLLAAPFAAPLAAQKVRKDAPSAPSAPAAPAAATAAPADTSAPLRPNPRLRPRPRAPHPRRPLPDSGSRLRAAPVPTFPDSGPARPGRPGRP